MNDKMNAIINLVILIMAMVFFFVGAILLAKWLEARKAEKINACHIHTAGRIYRWERGIVRMEKVWAEYFVNNKKYTVRGIVPDGIDIDERMSLEILYNQEYPAISRIDFASPSFTKDKAIKSVTGRIDFADTISAIVQFSYDVGDATYTCRQMLPKKRIVKTGERFPVEYLNENPRRGILKLDVSGSIKFFV